MPIPIENVLAAFPPSVKAGNVTLGPLSIGGAIRLAEIGVDARKTPVPKDKLFAAAWILSDQVKVKDQGEGWNHSSVHLHLSPSPAFRSDQVKVKDQGEGWNHSTVHLHLSPSPAFRKFLSKARCGLKELANAIEEVLNQAFLTFIPPQQQQDAPISLTPDGLGWPLELAGFLCAEYGWTFEYALATPVCRAFALQAVSRVQHGGKHGGPDYVERTLDIVKNAGN